VPDTLTHLVVSYVVARTLAHRRRLESLALSVAGIAPDLDALLRVHRSGSHSLALLLIAYLALEATR